MFEICTEDQRKRYEENLDFDFAYGIDDQARYRCNYFFQRTGYAAVMRLIPTKILTLLDLNLPEVLATLTELRSGLVLVTGPTGSGKSTTLAAMIDHINRRQRRHIVTIEDPVEFVHRNQQSIITHREVGAHTDSFANALRAVTRQDADVVLVGEMRDLETIALGDQRREHGHAGLRHAAHQQCPQDDRPDHRCVSQRPAGPSPHHAGRIDPRNRGPATAPQKAGRGRVAANEILLGSHAVSNIIREGKIEKIVSVLQSGRREGMQSMDDALDALVQEGTIDGSDAYMKAAEKHRFQQYVAEDD